jgi:futalosine hydrolase
MAILIFAATETEIAPLRQWVNDPANRHSLAAVKLIVTGAGILSSAVQITQSLIQSRPDLAIQVGIAGSFSLSLPPGAVTLVEQETVGDMGVWENHQFQDLFDLKLVTENIFPFTGKKLRNPDLDRFKHLNLPEVQGLTVNEISTDPHRIQHLTQKYQPQIETLEGASFHYAALQLKIPFIQIRGISNAVGERDKKNWKMNESIENSNRIAQAILTEQKS